MEGTVPSGGQPKPLCSVSKGLHLTGERPPGGEMAVGSSPLPTFSLETHFPHL